jgi:septum formation protein
MPSEVPHRVPLIILASRSPRRALLLREARLRFIQMDPPFEDPPQPDHGDAEAVTVELARRKAQSLRQVGVLEEHPDAVILGADTACVGADGTLYGQPHDRADAARMLREFIARPHRVVTGVALAYANDARDQTFADATEVHFGAINDHQLERYLASGDWRGKAGGYNLGERLTEGWLIEVAGDPGTVMGLPIRKLLPRLANTGAASQV